jgi:MFS family permease
VFNRIQKTLVLYPRQFWILFGGVLINAVGGSMIWPFLTIYLRQRLAVPLTEITLLFTLNSAAGLVALSLAGPAVDRFGRKRAMVLSLALTGLVALAMSVAGTLPAWAVLMALFGAFGPLYRVGGDAMVADLVPPERRPGAYALLRMAANAGIAIGPAAGGFVTGVSYSLLFYASAAAQFVFAGLVLLAVRETLPQPQADPGQSSANAGYGPVLADRPFLLFCGLYTVAVMPSPILMMLLPVYAKELFGVPESQYGFIMATNATMVVLFQYTVTRASSRYPHLAVLTAGALLYAVGAGSVALGQGFWHFWLSMVVLTLGELLLVPTATAVAANLAPADMRGRYMGLYNLTWGTGFGIGPVLGGLLNDHLAPVATWYGALVIGLAAAAGFGALAQWKPVKTG